MAIALRGARSGKKGPSGLNLVVLVPDEAVPLDWLYLGVILHGALDGSDYSLSPPEGVDWEAVDDRKETTPQAIRGVYAWRRKMQAGDDTFEFLGAGVPCPVTWVMWAVSGASDTAGNAATNGSSSNTTSHVAPSVTTKANNSWIFCVWSEEASPGSGNTTPGSMTHVASTRKAGSGGFGPCEIGVMSELIPSAGVTGTRTLTAATALGYVALTVEVCDSNAPQTLTEAGELQAVVSIGVPKVTGDVVLSTAEAALEQGSAADIFPAVVLQPWDRDAAATTTLRYSPARSYIPAAGTHAKKPFKARGESVVSIKRSLLAGGRVGGLGRPSAGDVKLLNPDGRLDILLGYAWDDRLVEIRMVGSDRYGTLLNWDDGFRLFKGRTVAPSDGFTSLALKIADVAKRLDRPAQKLTFAGTGGLEGPPELRGKRKPMCFGNPPSIRPVCVDKANQIYVFHVDEDGTGGTAVDAVYVGGNILSPDDYSAVLGAVNRVQINTSIGDSEVTLAVRMRATAPPAADLIEQLLLLGTVSGSERDLWSFARHAALSPGGAYYYVNGDETVGQVAAALLGPAGYLDIDADGKFVIGHWRNPEHESPDHVLKESRDLAIEPVSVQPPYWRMRVGYRKNFAQLSADQVVEAARATPYGIYATEPHLLIELSDETILLEEPNAPETNPEQQAEWVTPLLEEFDARLHAEALWAMYSRPWECYRVTTDRRAYRWRLGQVVELTHSRFGLGSGKRFRVAELEITDAGVTAILWGLRGTSVLAYETGDFIDLGDGSLIEFG